MVLVLWVVEVFCVVGVLWMDLVDLVMGTPRLRLCSVCRLVWCLCYSTECGCRSVCVCLTCAAGVCRDVLPARRRASRRP